MDLYGFKITLVLCLEFLCDMSWNWTVPWICKQVEGKSGPEWCHEGLLEHQELLVSLKMVWWSFAPFGGTRYRLSAERSIACVPSGRELYIHISRILTQVTDICVIWDFAFRLFHLFLPLPPV